MKYDNSGAGYNKIKGGRWILNRMKFMPFFALANVKNKQTGSVKSTPN